MPSAWAPMPGRERSRTLSAILKPCPSSPSRLATGTRTSSNASMAVGEPLDDTTRLNRQVERSPASPGVMDSDPGGQQPHRQTDAEIRKQRAKSRRADSFASPPNNNGKHPRKRTAHTRGKESTHKQEQ